MTPPSGSPRETVSKTMKRALVLFLLIMSSVFAQTPQRFPDDFLFGIANAPGHVEDQLDDIWMDFGRAGHIKAFLNQAIPEERLQFWSHPEVEINLAQELNVKIFRLGVDWGRIHTGPGQFDENAILRYREILGLVKAKDMKIMLTLFHFSMPKWIQEQGGWVNPETKKEFFEFAKKVMTEFHPQVDYWITFNEPQIFATMAYGFGFFPPGIAGGPKTVLTSLQEMISAHKNIYHWAHANIPTPSIGIAQHMGHHTARKPLHKALSKLSGGFMNWYFPNRIKQEMDYFGFNYYGAEWIKGFAISIDPLEEYSEAGRAINPRGLHKISLEIKKKFPNLPQFITENGVADATDWIRPSYLIEHLRVVQALLAERVKILGYIHWTLSDNMEWSDGYCPKFGLVGVERGSGLARVKRPSFFLYQKIITDRVITPEQRDSAWALLQSHGGEERPFCRSDDGQTGLDVPIPRKIRETDWRF